MPKYAVCLQLYALGQKSYDCESRACGAIRVIYDQKGKDKLCLKDKSVW